GCCWPGSACGPPGLVPPALLFPATGPPAPTGGLPVSFFLNAPGAPASTVPPYATLSLSPAARFTSASMSPLPLPLPQLAPAPLGTQVQPNPDSTAGNATCTRALLTLLGPAFATVMV